MRDIVQARLTQASEQRDTLVNRRQQLTVAREQVTAALNAMQGRVDELTELLALMPAASAGDANDHDA